MQFLRVLSSILGNINAKLSNAMGKHEVSAPLCQACAREVLLEELGLTTRVLRCLQRVGARTIGDLCDMTVKDLLYIRNISNKSLTEVQESLARLGLKLREE